MGQGVEYRSAQTSSGEGPEREAAVVEEAGQGDALVAGVGGAVPYAADGTKGRLEDPRYKPCAAGGRWLWGPRGCTGEVVIVPALDRGELDALFERVELAATFDCVDCMPYEDDLPIWSARNIRTPLA